ncbi:MAG TPA: phosphatase PAP2 family protein [Candidatus Sulfotelmatobacter sp.]|nr:phosphatase PAP2 family protein [Candidatus Sulfotelmatobacter sp.]
MTPADSTPTFSRSDMWLGAVVAAGVLAIGQSDHWMAGQLKGAGGDPAEKISDLATPFGTATVLAPLLLAGLAAGPVLGQPGVTRASIRIGAGICASAVACEALKVSFGRTRPFQTPGDPDEFHPFSGFDSFPSGHTTVAFAAAAGLTRETHARWVPWVAYPLAGLVGWSRVHDGWHWPSDVVAGAALGVWSAEKTEDYLRRRDALGGRFSAWLMPERRGETVAVAWAF